jgi:hypothetical protein
VVVARWMNYAPAGNLASGRGAWLRRKRRCRRAIPAESRCAGQLGERISPEQRDGYDGHADHRKTSRLLAAIQFLRYAKAKVRRGATLRIQGEDADCSNPGAFHSTWCGTQLHWARIIRTGTPAAQID